MLEEKEEITKLSGIHPLGTMNVLKFPGNPSNREISVEIKVVDIPRAAKTIKIEKHFGSLIYCSCSVNAQTSLTFKITLCESLHTARKLNVT